MKSRKTASKRNSSISEKSDAVALELKDRALMAAMRIIGACVSMTHQFDIRRAQIAADEVCACLCLETTHKQIDLLESEARRAIADYNMHKVVMKSSAARRSPKSRGRPLKISRRAEN